MALVVVGGALGQPGLHRQDRLGAVQRLDLRLLVDAQHDGPLGRVQIQADDVADLGDELRVPGQLERLRAVRLQPERLPDPVHRRLVEPDLRCHRPRRPMRRVLRRRTPSVLVITSSTFASLIVRGCPGRGSSTSPSSRSASNRRRHFATVLRCTPKPLGDLARPQPLRGQPTRSASAPPTPRDVVSRRDHDTSCSRSASLSSIDTTENDGMTPPSPLAHELMHQDTSRPSSSQRRNPAPCSRPSMSAYTPSGSSYP